MAITSRLKEVWLQSTRRLPACSDHSGTAKAFFTCPRKAKRLSAESSLRRAGDCSRSHSVSPLYDITSLGRMACAYFCAEADVSPTLSWPMPWGFVCLRGSCARLHQRCGSAVQSPHSRCVARVAGLCTVMCIANADSH